MTGKSLIEWIVANHMEDADVIVGCEGYCNEKKPDNRTQICRSGSNKIMIADECYYDEFVGA